MRLKFPPLLSGCLDFQKVSWFYDHPLSGFRLDVIRFSDILIVRQAETRRRTSGVVARIRRVVFLYTYTNADDPRE